MNLVEQVRTDLQSLKNVEAEVLSGRRVLLVEDDKNDAELTSTKLESMGISVDVAFSVREASEKLDAHQTYRMVFVDLVLGNETAGKVLRRIKSELPSIPVTILTGSVDPVVALLVKELGWAVLQKPSSVEDFKQAFSGARVGPLPGSGLR